MDLQHVRLTWMMLEVVIAPLAGDKCWPLFSAVSGLWSWLVLVDSGLMLGLGEIPMRLRMTATHVGAFTFLKASSRPFSSCPLLCNGGNPRPSSLVQAVASLWRRSLLGGTVRVARVPRRPLVSRLTTSGAWASRARCTLKWHLFGYPLLGFGWALPFTRHHFFLAFRGGPYVGTCHLRARMVFSSCLTSVVKRSVVLCPSLSPSRLG
jgi:hypothetical protein